MYEIKWHISSGKSINCNSHMSEPVAAAEKVARALSIDNIKSMPIRILVVLSPSSCGALPFGSLLQLQLPKSSTKDVDTVAIRIGGRAPLRIFNFLVTALIFDWISKE